MNSDKAHMGRQTTHSPPLFDPRHRVRQRERDGGEVEETKMYIMSA